MAYWNSSKALNPDNLNEFGEVIASSGDSLPVGTEVDYNGNESNIPIGWEKSNGKDYTEYILYNDANGSNDAITLSDSAANYDYIEIFYRQSESHYNSVKVYSPNNKRIALMNIYSTENYKALQEKIVLISGTSISTASNTTPGELIVSNSTPRTTESNLIYITRVVGYKEA